tara:strand:+ start:28208 stop:28858 length:651 start_codon:yes stop_codon:yes gene_type:complete
MIRPVLLAMLALLSTACTGTRKLVDPTLRVQTESGVELGVSTQYGVVFLGRTARSGFVEIEAYFGDGPTWETSVIEPLGGGLYTAETEIRLPSVPLKFHDPRKGEVLELRGRNAEGAWRRNVVVRADERVLGLLIDVPPELVDAPDQVGAGLYWRNPSAPEDIRLVGLVAGRVRLERDGRERSYLAVEGARSLWRLVIHRRDHNKRKPPIYREDIL